MGRVDAAVKKTPTGKVAEKGNVKKGIGKKAGGGAVEVSPMLRKVLKMSQEVGGESRTQLVQLKNISETSDLISSPHSGQNVSDLLRKLANGDIEQLELKCIQKVFSIDSFKLFCEKEDFEFVEEKLRQIIGRCGEDGTEIGVYYIYKFTVKAMTNVPCFLHTKQLESPHLTLENGESKSAINQEAKLIHCCLHSLSLHEANIPRFINCLKYHFKKVTLESISQHELFVTHLLHFSSIKNDQVLKSAVRNLLIEQLLECEKMASFGKTDVVQAIDVYMNYLAQEILQVFPLNNTNMQSFTCNYYHKLKPSEAKIVFSFYCHKLKNLMEVREIKYLPFLFLPAASIHSSFTEHLVRVLWDLFRNEHSFLSIHWLASFTCDTNLVMFPLVKDLMRHVSVHLCSLLKHKNAFRIETKQHSLTSDQFHIKQQFVFGFYLLVKLFVHYHEKLTASDSDMAFVKSLRFDKFICCTIQPLSFLPQDLLNCFTAITAANSTIFPNVLLFINTQTHLLSKNEQLSLMIEHNSIFESYDLDKSKWAIQTHLLNYQRVDDGADVDGNSDDGFSDDDGLVSELSTSSKSTLDTTNSSLNNSTTSLVTCNMMRKTSSIASLSEFMNDEEDELSFYKSLCS